MSSMPFSLSHMCNLYPLNIFGSLWAASFQIMPVIPTVNFQKSHIMLGSRVVGWLFACYCGNPVNSQETQIDTKAAWRA